LSSKDPKNYRQIIGVHPLAIWKNVPAPPVVNSADKTIVAVYKVAVNDPTVVDTDPSGAVVIVAYRSFFWCFDLAMEYY
jgi:hypothetical protein